MDSVSHRNGQKHLHLMFGETTEQLHLVAAAEYGQSQKQLDAQSRKTPHLVKRNGASNVALPHLHMASTSAAAQALRGHILFL